MKTLPRVTLFVQCLVDGMYPEVGEAVVRIFRKLGIEIECPVDQTCCGQPAYNSGYLREAAVAAKRFIEIFEQADCIVCPSGSCVHMVRRYYLDLFKGDHQWLQRAQRVASITYELTEFLVDVLEVEDLGATFEGRVTYHDSCHLYFMMGVREQPRKLLGRIRGLDLIEMKDANRCCGFGGAFSIKYPEISTAVTAEKVKNIIDSGAEVVTGCDVSCLMNIQGFLSRKKSDIRTMHIAQLIAG